MAVNEQQRSQIKSKERVSERGEVFTAEREVNAMLDLVANECLRPDSRFLEPARFKVTESARSAWRIAHHGCQALS